MIKRIVDNITAIKTEGIERYATRKFQSITHYQAPSFKQFQSIFQGKDALEIGGPSKIFQEKNIFPIYPLLNTVDGCNFSASTVWEGQIQAGKNYQYDKNKIGNQYICEASELTGVERKNYDILLSSHSLEHLANPLKALQKWHEHLNKKGYFLLILPNPTHTFDNKRPITTIEHLLQDFEDNVDEKDLTCLKEVIALHDFKKDPYGEKDLNTFKDRCTNNFENRCLHHHVFSVDLIKKMLHFADFSLVSIEKIKPYHIITIAQKN